MTINIMQGALAAALLQSAKQPTGKVLSVAALSALTPGVLGLALPLAVLGARKAPVAAPAAPPLVLVPDLQGVDEAAALRQLRQADLLAQVQLRSVRGVQGVPGRVVAQSPLSGAAVEAGSTVLLYVQPEPDPDAEPDNGDCDQ